MNIHSVVATLQPTDLDGARAIWRRQAVAERAHVAAGTIYRYFPKALTFRSPLTAVRPLIALDRLRQEARAGLPFSGIAAWRMARRGSSTLEPARVLQRRSAKITKRRNTGFRRHRGRHRGYLTL
jgi:hypothetical protein